MKTRLIQKVTAISIIATILFISSVQNTRIFADEKNDKNSSVNGVVVRAVFKFGSQVETIDNFKVFKQLGGFDRSTMPSFTLEGIVDGDRPLLYQTVDETYHRGQNPNDRHEFDVDVYLHNDKLLRHFVYSNCIVKDYSVTTDFDDKQAWSGDKKFAIVDKFNFECNGYGMKNPVLEQKIKDEQKLESAKIMEMFKRQLQN